MRIPRAAFAALSRRQNRTRCRVFEERQGRFPRRAPSCALRARNRADQGGTMSEEAIRKDEDEDEDVEAHGHGGGPRPHATAEPRDDEGSEDEPDVEAHGHGGGPRPT